MHTELPHPTTVWLR